MELNGLPSAISQDLRQLTKGVVGRWTSSGRGALSLVFRALRGKGVHRVHLPAFICGSVVAAAKASGLDCSYYPVGWDLSPEPDPPRRAAVLFVDYFGWRSEAIQVFAQNAEFDSPVVEDACQALLSHWPAERTAGHHVVLSPRKFAPVTLCGWSSLADYTPGASSELERMAWQSLASRLVKGTYMSHSEQPVNRDLESFYLASFAEIEGYLDGNCDPTEITTLAASLIRRVDWRGVGSSRRRNWVALNECLAGHVEPLFDRLPTSVVPLGYVVKLRDRDKIRRMLAERRVFCAVHWPLAQDVSASSFPTSAMLSRSLLTLPIDQRYECGDMERLAEIVRSVV
jgi:hypothetical protein